MQVQTPHPSTSSGRADAWTRVVPVLVAVALGGLTALAGVLVGEGVYGLTVVAQATPAAYWWGSVVVRVVLTAVASTVRLRGRVARVVAPAVAAAVAGAFVVLYAYGGSVIGML